jgi:hypothetical protein
MNPPHRMAVRRYTNAEEGNRRPAEARHTSGDGLLSAIDRGRLAGIAAAREIESKRAS